MKKKLKLRKTPIVKQSPLEFAGEYPVVIGVPVPMIDHKFMAGLSHFITGAAARKVGLPLTVDSRNSENGRNQIIEEFLTKPEFKDKKYLFFVDNDTVPVNPHTIEEMIKLDKPVVSGVTPITYKRGKDMYMYWNVRREKEKRSLFLDELPNQPFTCDYVGGSCILIRRDVLEKLEPPYQKATYCEKQIHFKIGEDYYFCDKVRNAGFEIWIHPALQCRHYHVLDMLDIILMLARYAQSMTDEGVRKSYEYRIAETLRELEELKIELEEYKKMKGCD